jgi:hypothetical protein
MISELSGRDPITYHYTRKSVVKSLKLAMWGHSQNTTSRLVLPHVPTRQVGVRCWYCLKSYQSSLLFDTKTPTYQPFYCCQWTWSCADKVSTLSFSVQSFVGNKKSTYL